MTAATKVLRSEHEAILRMLDATEEVARRIMRGTAVAPETLSSLVEFFRVFADRCHHGKEEDCLFPLLEEKGLPHDGGPVAVMLHEHGQGRDLIKNMSEALETFSKGQKEASSRWADSALGYVSLLRAHIAKENDVLFMIADRLLSESDQAKLAEAFEDVETNKIGAGTHERLHGLMQKLIAEIFPDDK
ncbi:MAG TPA: hemerythrin domain-containing protein [Acidobacteriota bacterium]|nr:hemerythrin domain-containing protein [Acidobacteriota bacterium]